MNYMKRRPRDYGACALTALAVLLSAVAPTQAQGKKPNIVVIMGDDIGIWNIGAYHRGMMAGRTPNLDRLAAEGMLFTDYYAEASCTAGRAAFITGELPIRTGMTTVGQAGSPVGLPAQAVTVAAGANLSILESEVAVFGPIDPGDLIPLIISATGSPSEIPEDRPGHVID